MLNFHQFINQKTNESVSGSFTNPDKRLVKAADLIARVINKKTGNDYKQYLGNFEIVKDGEKNTGVYYISDKNNTSFRVLSNYNSNSPGIVGAIEFFEDFSIPVCTWTFSSKFLPIVSLVKDAAMLMSNKKYYTGLAEARSYDHLRKYRAISNKEIDDIKKLLASGKNISEISEIIDLPIDRLVDIKKSQKIQVIDDPLISKNEEILSNKALRLEQDLEDLYDITRVMAAGKPGMNALFITGRAGTGKTYNVEKALHDEGLEEGDDYVKISGAVSTIMMYKAMFQYKDKVLVFDDCDAVFSNEDGRNILKAALDTKEVRKISLMKKLKMLYDPKEYETNPQGELDEIESGNVPNQFEFSGRVIFISNLAKEKADPDGAIRSRSLLFDINPDDDTLLERLKRLLPHMEPKDMPLSEKQEIFDFLNESKDISMRTFVKAASLKASGLRNWKRITKNHL